MGFGACIHNSKAAALVVSQGEISCGIYLLIDKFSLWACPKKYRAIDKKRLLSKLYRKAGSVNTLCEGYVSEDTDKKTRKLKTLSVSIL